MFNHSHIRHFSSVFVSLRDFQLITQNSSENIASRQSRCIYVNGTNKQTLSFQICITVCFCNNFFPGATRNIVYSIVNRARWFGNSLELQYKSLSMFLFWFMQE